MLKPVSPLLKTITPFVKTMNISFKKTAPLLLCGITLLSPFSAFSKAGAHLINGKLADCPDKPNCINTENNDMPPISFSSQTPESVWLIVQDVIKARGGRIVKSDGDYLWATFETSLLKFTDDVEIRLDRTAKKIHLRSASRVGYYDFNANKKRIKAISFTIIQKLTSKH